MEGVPLVGTVYNDTIDYYYLEIRDSSSAYEVTLTPRTGGNPDLVLSYQNQFPDLKNKDLISDKDFSSDSILIEPSMISEYEAKKRINVSRVYLGVYTKAQEHSGYSIVATRKESRTPIQLQNGQL